ncbi:MAG: hypothetical protein GWM98_25540, partial [Nitrospinaceae bacterium]|nr:hypothetical protein [Nitrospinaceae bacterium]NIS87666.1 hypothetical protein [Nitrospinaceae bacterium]NIT84532.1 hypothetical protein [Nitrospinaceae bacterium]NIW08283.1 hypothetical protein [Nitrospinaceae bacterium]NIY17992.1 hypothetical protein [Nitrospinaceae bacterium]
MLAVAAVLLHYYFPGEKIRPLVEKELSRRLRMPVTVGSLDFSLFRGARIAEVRLGETPGVLNVQELRLDYDLTQLVQGNLVINQVLVDRPEVTLVARDGVWNFQPLLELAGPAEPQEPAPPGKEFPGLPPLPLGVDLQRLAVQNIRLDLNQEGTTTAHLDGLSLEMQGQARREGLEVALRVTLRPPARDAQRHNVRFAATEGAGMDFKTRGLLDFRFFTRDLNRVQFTGTFNLEDNEARLGQPLPSPDLAGEIDLQAEVRKQAVKISRLLVHTVHGNRVEIAGEAENILSDPTFRVLLKEATFLIEDLVGWGRPFLPPVKAGGRIRVSGLETTGRMQESRPQEIEMRGGTLRLENVYADHLPTGAWIDGLSGDIQLKNVRLEQNVPQRLKLDLHMTLGAAAMKELTVKGLELQYALTGEGPNLPQVNLSFDTHLNRLEYSAPDLNPIATSLQAKGSLRGNLASGNFDPFQ